MDATASSSSATAAAEVAIALKPMPIEAADTRLAYIDSLRAIAAILVLWTHVSETFYRIGPRAMESRWLYDWPAFVNAGRIGVVAFFAISGFVVPFSIKLGHKYPVREFLLKRFFRIFPAYWLSIPFGILTMYWIWNRPFSLTEVLVNLTMLEYVFDVRPAIGLYWTLAVEFVFYVCCALLVLAGSINNYRRIGLLAIALIATHVAAIVSTQLGWTAFNYLKTQWFLNLGVMFWGTLYRAHTQHALADPIAKWCLWGILAFLLGVYPLLFKLIGIPYGHTAPYSVGILLFVLGTTVFRISIRPLPMLGAISYSIYLFHPVVFNPILRTLQVLPPDSWWRSWHLGFYIVAVLVLTIAVAMVVYRLVEKPSIEMARRLARRWWGNASRSAFQRTSDTDDASLIAATTTATLRQKSASRLNSG